jgi:hypothetical protein
MTPATRPEPVPQRLEMAPMQTPQKTAVPQKLEMKPVEPSSRAELLTARVDGDKTIVSMGYEGQGPKVFRAGERGDLRRLVSEVIALFYDEPMS